MALIDRIKFDGPDGVSDTSEAKWLVYKFPEESLVLGSQLIVHESQEAIFYNEGKALDVFGPGRHILKTANLPLLKKIVNIPFGGKTPFTAEVYFVNKVSKLNMKYGTQDPIPIQDPKFGIIMNVRSFGQFGIKILDSRKFVAEIIGALKGSNFSNYEIITNYFKGLVGTKLKDAIADTIINKKLSIFEVSASLDSLSSTCKNRLEEEFKSFGINIINFFIESINIPKEDSNKLKEILEKRAEFSIIGDERYKLSRMLDVLDKAASNEGTGGVGVGLGMGLGTGMAAGKTFGDLFKDIRDLDSKPAIEERIKCPECGKENNSDSKFCANCGKKIITEKKICPKCKTENLNNFKYCSNCGESLENIICKNCNFENPSGTKFCGSCGNKL